MTFVFELRTFRRAISAAYLPPLWKANVTFAEIKQTRILVYHIKYIVLQHTFEVEITVNTFFKFSFLSGYKIRIGFSPEPQCTLCHPRISFSTSRRFSVMKPDHTI